MAKFDDLPEEIILKIFSYIPQSCLQKSVAAVCKKWKRISRDNSLYYNVQFDSKLSLKKAIDLTYRYSNFINSLVISKRSDTDNILKVLPICQNLKSLIVNSCSGCSFSCGKITSEVNANLISSILEKNEKLSLLWITHSTIRNGCIKMSGRSLEKLILKNAYYHRSIEERGLLEQNSLKVLNLQGLIINKSSLYKVIVRNHRTLQSVKLDVWEPQLGSNDQIIEAISKCFNLKELLIKNASFYNISDRSFQHLTKLKLLTTVTFSKMDNVSSKAFVCLFKQPLSKNFTRIYLSACDGVDNTVIKTIAEYCPYLIKLGLHQPKITASNIITSEDILYLASKCVKIQVLDLCYMHNSIGRSIPKIVEYLPDLWNFKYCDNSPSNAKLILGPTINLLIKNLKNFEVTVELNSHLDEIIHGVRSDAR